MSMGSLDFLLVDEYPLDLDIHSLANWMVQHDISKLERVVACVEARSSLVE